MLCLPCAACGTPKPVPELHAWSMGDPLCSEACAQAHPAPEPVAKEAALAAAHAEIHGLAALVRACLPAAAQAESALASARSAASAETGFMLGLAAGPLAVALARGAANAAVSSSSDRLMDRLMEIEDGVRQVLRRVMVLEALGLGLAQHATPLVTHFGALANGSASGLHALLQQLHRYLEGLDAALDGTVDAHDQPARQAAPRSRKCPRCYGRLEPDTAGYTEAGLVCALCVAEARAVDAAQAASSNDAPPPHLVALNAIGIAGLVGAGVGFTAHSTGPSKREQEARREAARRAAARRRRAVFLRRDGREVGPYDLDELLSLQKAGHVRETDEFWIEGMKAWRRMSAFSPSLLDG